jgi:hypothetical protein
VTTVSPPPAGVVDWVAVAQPWGWLRFWMWLAETNQEKAPWRLPSVAVSWWPEKTSSVR